MSRSLTIDILRGMGLMIMATNHVLIKLFPDRFFHFPYFNVSTSFNMGIFLVIAGYLAYRSLLKHPNHLKWLKNKAYYLVLPHIVFNLGLYFVSKTGITEWGDLSSKWSFGQWAVSSLFFDAGEWFLWILFICLAILVLVHKLNVKKGESYILPISIIALAVILIPMVNGEFMRFYRVQFYFPLALLGYLIARYQSKITEVVTVKRVTVFSFVMLGVYALALYLSGWNGGWGSIPFTNMFHQPAVVALRFMQVLSILPMVFLIGYGISKIPLVSNILSWLGGITLGVYLFSMLFTKVGFGDGWLMVVSSILLSLSISIIITLTLKYLVFRKVNKYVLGVA